MSSTPRPGESPAAPMFTKAVMVAMEAAPKLWLPTKTVAAEAAVGAEVAWITEVAAHPRRFWGAGLPGRNTVDETTGATM
jgi:hypothetical protein